MFAVQQGDRAAREFMASATTDDILRLLMGNERYEARCREMSVSLRENEAALIRMRSITRTALDITK